MSGNKINSIQRDIFLNNKELQWLNLERNCITNIHTLTLRYNIRLRHLNKRFVNKVMRLIQYNSVLSFKLQIEFVPFKNRSLERLHTSGDVVPTLRSNAGSH